MNTLPVKKEILQNAGDAKYQEDELVYLPSRRIFGVLDGVSGLYHPDDGPRVIEGMSEAQKVAQIFARELAGAAPDEELSDILLRANKKTAEFSKSLGLSLGESEKLPAVDAAIAKISGGEIEIVQTSDCFAIWKLASGEVGATKSQSYKFEQKISVTGQARIKDFGTQRGAQWTEKVKYITEMRRKLINRPGGYAMFNGQPEVASTWQHVKLRRADVRLLILCTDGLVKLEDTGDEKKLAEQVLRQYQEDGLWAILRETRKQSQAEATAIALEF